MTPLQVGVGLKTSLCASTCDDWYAACRNDFFGYQGQRQGLQPCTEADTERLQMCSKLSELAADGAGLCEAAGGGRGCRGGGGMCEASWCSAAGHGTVQLITAQRSPVPGRPHLASRARVRLVLSGCLALPQTTSPPANPPASPCSHPPPLADAICLPACLPVSP
jgi:hypothetical protein